ncbi:LysR family transcriptional regulator [Erythrobacter rubeus]|uniref:LysR family transcriptional regulator n=1 Tax=Erythrobacter rubeus TaxID=2760803 RepID=A0ABR8KQT9_9SPHN|nr:LysR family transcriptional regulator [Erythrobacter rubeus]MBD2841905.1 LysR family transcriptional regulator [Erythrobacter rubeus]
MNKFEEMRTFSAVADHGVNGASRALHIAPSAVSRRVKDLESRLGTQLFSRTGRSMTLTDDGERFLATAREIMEQLEEAEVRMRDAQGTLVGRLRVAAPLSFGMRYVVPALNQFLSKHPNLDLDLNLDDRRVDIVREGFDVAIRVGDLPSSSLRAKRLGTWPFVVAASPEFVSRHPPIRAPEDLNGAPGLLYAPKARPDVWIGRTDSGQMEQATLVPKLVSNNGDALRAASVDSLGVLCEPHFIIADELANGQLVQLLSQFDFGEVEAHALWPAQDYMPARLRALIDHMSASFADTDTR